MKMVKSLLLGSAAGVAAVAVAQAADLPVKAAPVQYVKICTLYGDGFYYIPGSDTCIKFTGYIRIDYGWNETNTAPNHYTGASGAQDRTVSRFNMRHRGAFAVDTRTQTGYGTLRTYQLLHVENQSEGTVNVILARAFIQWGGFTFGRTVSFTDHEGSVGDAGFRSVYATQADSTTGANGTNQIAYTWALGNGATFNVGADERRVKGVGNLSGAATTVGTNPANSSHGQSHPDPWVALRVSQVWGAASIAFVGHKNAATYWTQNPALPCAQINTTQCQYPDDKWGWALITGVDFKANYLSPGSHFGGYFNYAVGASSFGASLLGSPGLFGSGNQVAWGFITDSVYLNGSQQELTTVWTVGGGFEYFWTRNFATAVYGTYTEVSYGSTVVNNRWFCGGGGAVAGNVVLSAATACDPGFKFWTVGMHNDWYPIPGGLRLVVDTLFTGVESAAGGATISLSKAQGARPTGIYTAKNLGITSVVFRAIRLWGG